MEQKNLLRTHLKSDHRYNDFKRWSCASMCFFTGILITLEITSAVMFCYRVWQGTQLHHRPSLNKQASGFDTVCPCKKETVNTPLTLLLDKLSHLCMVWGFFPVFLQSVITVYRSGLKKIDSGTSKSQNVNTATFFIREWTILSSVPPQ